jgi:uncharacterized protein
MGRMQEPRFAGLVLTPGAGGGSAQPGLVAIEERLTPLGIAVSRVAFPGQVAGRRRPDPPVVCIETVRAAVGELADALGVPTSQVAAGGRSFGGRMCSMAAAEGLDVACLVLVSYPLHPPGKPDRLRTAHFPALDLPCLFVSGARDPFASPEELDRETAAIPGPVTLTILDGDHGLRRREGAAADAIASWAMATTEHGTDGQAHGETAPR